MLQITEARQQANCYQWFHNRYPHLRGCLCYNLNNSKNKIDGAKNKAMGLQPGRSDLDFYYYGITYFFEGKCEGEKQSKVQIEWQKLMIQHGFKYYIFESEKDFQDLICNIIK